MTQRRVEPDTEGALDRWYITAPHRQTGYRNGKARDLPFGVGHLRRPGAPFTACALPALNWPIFWLLDTSEAMDKCTKCLAIALQTRPSNDKYVDWSQAGPAQTRGDHQSVRGAS